MNFPMKSFLVVLALALGVAPSNSIGAIAASTDDQNKGRILFEASCAGCHSTTSEVESYGPNLNSLSGRPAGSVGFTSDALKTSGIVWTADTLDKFLVDPASQVPGTTMPVAIRDPAERAAVVEFIINL